MKITELSAISPIDGRYAKLLPELQEIFSEYALIKYRIFVEIEWFIHLSRQPNIKELPHLTKQSITFLSKIEKNFSLAEAKKIKPEEIIACVLKRPRHDKIVSSLKSLNVKIKFIQDGDVTGVISVVDTISPIDIYLGIGGGPEGVLAAAALDCLGGQMQTRLVLSDDKEINRAKKLGINDLNKKYNIEDMIKGDVIFCASGVTDGEMLKGITYKGDSFEASSFVLHKSQKIFKKITNIVKK